MRTGLSKTFAGENGTEIKAVNNLSLSMYSGQITCLLGHNGAGKTTTVSMLTGLYPPTSGDAFVFGRSLVNDLEGVRSKLGVCPQHDILFERLTGLEHLLLFAAIKGTPADQAQRASEQLLREVGLTSHKDKDAMTLSGGQKRRLSVAMALIGDPEVLFLVSLLHQQVGLPTAFRSHCCPG